MYGKTENVRRERSFVIILTTLTITNHNDKLVRPGKEFRTRGINSSPPQGIFFKFWQRIIDDTTFLLSISPMCPPESAEIKEIFKLV